MKKDVQELQSVLALLLERRQAYVDVISKASACPLEKTFLIPNEKLLSNIEQLIAIIIKSIWDKPAIPFYKNRIPKTIRNNSSFINGIRLSICPSGN